MLRTSELSVNGWVLLVLPVREILFRKVWLVGSGKDIGIATLCPTRGHQAVDLSQIGMACGGRRWVLHGWAFQDKEKQGRSCAAIKADHADGIAAPTQEAAALEL